MINRYMDAGKNAAAPCSLPIFDDKKKARKAMMDLAAQDLTRGNYYFYFLDEYTTYTHEIYPTPCVS